uniref:B30.2/SPRY domain-containing protein n=1 Tax=Esox lucius TaxID=8010 RepID=A0A3P9ACE9_ESOLU
ISLEPYTFVCLVCLVCLVQAETHAETQAEMQQTIRETQEKVKEVKHSLELAAEHDSKSHGDEFRDFQRYAVDVTLDPDTAHPALRLSKDRKELRVGDKCLTFTANPKRFYPVIIVLGKTGFCSGRFYYEVQVKGKTSWELGLARESITRTGGIILSPENGYWTIWLRNGKYVALANPPVTLSLRKKPQKVGVFVDYEKGLASFFDMDNRSHIYSFTGQNFIEKLYPYFSPGRGGRDNSAPLVIRHVTGTH